MCHGARTHSRPANGADSPGGLRAATRIGQHRPRWSARLDRAAAQAGRRTVGTVARSISFPVVTSDGGGGLITGARGDSQRDPSGMTRARRCHIRSAAPLPRASRRGRGRCRACGRTERVHKSLGKPTQNAGFPHRPRPVFFGRQKKGKDHDVSRTRLALRPGISNSLTGRFREDLSEGLWNYVRANMIDVST